MIQERLLELAERTTAQPVSEEPGDWTLVGRTRSVPEQSQKEIRDRARHAVRENPYACNILRLLEAYVTGPGLQLAHQPREGKEQAEQPAILRRANELWQQFLVKNERHYSFREHARRTWRDGECFVRLFPTQAWPPSVRFVDPELIGGPSHAGGTQGIVTDPHDVETPVAFLKVHPTEPHNVERIPADEILMTRIGVDSNEKRGLSLLAPLLSALDSYEKWMETEILARKLQSSIVLWRKVQGSPQLVDGLADQAGISGRDGRRERFSPGTVLTTNHGTDIQFLQPNTNFGDAVPLGRMLLLSAAAGAGLPEFMLTADASNANFASTMVAEGPAVKFFQSEQQFFATEFTRLWRWIMDTAIQQGHLPEDFFERIDLRWAFPQLVNRDRPKERSADVRLIDAGVLSRAEVARRDGVDPAIMRAERLVETSSLDQSTPATGE
jgi:capsid protein